MAEERDVRLFLDDILENLRLAREFTADLSSAAELAANRKTLYAVIRAQEIRDQVPEVPWAAMAGMRDRLIHGYRKVDTALVWRTATAATVEAEDGVKRLLAQLDAEAE